MLWILIISLHIDTGLDLTILILNRYEFIMKSNFEVCYLNAKSGDPQSQYELACFYEEGNGVDKDITKAKDPFIADIVSTKVAFKPFFDLLAIILTITSESVVV